MFQYCSICSDVERRQKVDALLEQGCGLVAIAAAVDGISKSVVGRHKLNCAENNCRPFRDGDKWTSRYEHEPSPTVFLKRGAIHFDCVIAYEPAIEIPGPPPEEIPAAAEEIPAPES